MVKGSYGGGAKFSMPRLFPADEWRSPEQRLVVAVQFASSLLGLPLLIAAAIAFVGRAPFTWYLIFMGWAAFALPTAIESILADGRFRPARRVLGALLLLVCAVSLLALVTMIVADRPNRPALFIPGAALAALTLVCLALQFLAGRAPHPTSGA